MILNTPSDLAAASGAELEALLLGLYNDFVRFDDANCPENYDHTLKEGDPDYVAPVVRLEWNSGAAAAWGFADRQQLEAAIEALS